MKLLMPIAQILILVFPMTSFSAELDAATLRKKTFKAVENVVSAGDYPQKCIVKYSISSKSTTRSGGGIAKEERERRMALAVAAAEEGGVEGLQKLMEQLDSGEKKSTTTEQLTATLKYKSGGIVHEDIILDLEASAESPQALIINMAEVMANFDDRACNQAKAADSSNESDTTSSNRSALNKAPGIR